MDLKAKVIPIAFSLTLGFLPGVWVRVWLDPSGTGGSILALIAICLVVLFTISFFIAGIFLSSQSFGKWMVVSSSFIPIAFSMTAAIFR